MEPEWDVQGVSYLPEQDAVYIEANHVCPALFNSN